MEKETFKSANVMIIKEGDDQEKNRVKVVLTKEVVDDHGEIVDVDGVDLKRYKKNPIVLWQHPQTKFFSGGIQIEDIMGQMGEITKEKDKKGVKMITGIVEFADHEKAQTLKRLVMMGIIKTVSVGMGVSEYEEEEIKKGVKIRRLTKTNLFETSFVAMPANTEAEVIDIVRSNDFGTDRAKDVIVKLLNLADIKPKIKKYRELFLSDEICDMLEYEKTGDEIKDIQKIHELLTTKKVEEPEDEPEETPKALETPKSPRRATNEEVENMFMKAFKN